MGEWGKTDVAQKTFNPYTHSLIHPFTHSQVSIAANLSQDFIGKRIYMSKNIGSQAKEGVFWTVFFDSIEFVVSIGSSIILARLLVPADFGTMGLVSIAIQFARRLANFGFSTVLVQLKEVKDEHYDTVYITNLVLMALVAGIVFFSAHYYSVFFNTPGLELILQVIAFDFLLKAFSSVPESILKRYMRFKELGMAQSAGKFGTIISTVILAIAGYGVWALVLGTMIGSFCHRTASIRFALKYANWKPRFKFRRWALKDCFSFGAWVYFSTFVSFGINKVDYFLIGKFLGTSQLGFYERAFELMSLPRKQLVRKVNSVLFSSYSRIQDDNARVVRGFLRVATFLSFIAYPLMIWLFFVSPSFITVVYGEKWVGTILPLQIMCLTGIIDSYTLIFQPLMKAKGMVGHHARRDFLYLIFLSVAVFVAISLGHGIAGVAVGVTAVSLVRLSLMLNLAVRNLPMTVWDFIMAQKSAIVYGLIQIGACLLVEYFTRPWFAVDSLPMMIIISVVALVAFVGAHLVIRFADVDEVFDEIVGDLKKVSRKVPVLKKLGFVQKKS